MGHQTNVLLLHSGHSNDLVYIAGLGAAFEKLGHKLIGVSVKDEAEAQDAIRAVVEEPDEFLCMVSVSYYGLSLFYGDEPLHHCTSVPLVMWLLDNPALFKNPVKDVLGPDPSTIILGSNDRAHIDYWHRYIAAETPALEINMGVGQDPRLVPEPQDLDAFMARDDVAILPVHFTHFGMNLNTTGDEIRRLSPLLAKVAWEAIDMTVHDLALPPFRAIEKVAESRSVELDADNMSHLTLLVDSYVKLWRRHNVMKQLLDLPVRFLGEGFPEFHQFGRHWKFENITMPQIFDEYRAARYVVSIGPAFPRLVHERILQSIDAGAAVIAERSPGIAETFTDGEEIACFDLTTGDAAAKLTDWMSRPEDAWRLNTAARRRMLEDDVHGANARRIRDRVLALQAEGWRHAS